MPPWDYFNFCSFLFAARLRKDMPCRLGYLRGDYFLIWDGNGYRSLGMGERPPAIWGTLNPKYSYWEQNHPK